MPKSVIFIPKGGLAVTLSPNGIPVRVVDGAIPDTTSPTITGLTITGTPRIGQTLTAAATITGANDIAYRWLRDGGNINSATHEDYPLVAEDDGAQISVRITATGDGGETVETSNAVAVTYPAPVASGTIADVTYTEDTGNQTVDVTGAFTGAVGGDWVIQPTKAGVTVADGVVTINTAVATTGNVAVRYANSGGTASAAFTLTINEATQSAALAFSALNDDPTIYDATGGPVAVPLSGTGEAGAEIEARLVLDARVMPGLYQAGMTLPQLHDAMIAGAADGSLVGCPVPLSQLQSAAAWAADNGLSINGGGRITIPAGVTLRAIGVDLSGIYFDGGAGSRLNLLFCRWAPPANVFYGVNSSGLSIFALRTDFIGGGYDAALTTFALVDEVHVIGCYIGGQPSDAFKVYSGLTTQFSVFDAPAGGALSREEWSAAGSYDTGAWVRQPGTGDYSAKSWISAVDGNTTEPDWTSVNGAEVNGWRGRDTHADFIQAANASVVPEIRLEWSVFLMDHEEAVRDYAAITTGPNAVYFPVTGDADMSGSVVRGCLLLFAPVNGGHGFGRLSGATLVGNRVRRTGSGVFVSGDGVDKILQGNTDADTGDALPVSIYTAGSTYQEVTNLPEPTPALAAQVDAAGSPRPDIYATSWASMGAVDNIGGWSGGISAASASPLIAQARYQGATDITTAAQGQWPRNWAPAATAVVAIDDFAKDINGNTPVFTSLAAQGKNEGQLPASGTGTAGAVVEARVIEDGGTPVTAWSAVATVDGSGKWDAVVKGGTRSVDTRYRVEARAAGATDTVYSDTCFIGETGYVTGQSDLYYAIGNYTGDAGTVTADHDYRVRFIIGTRRGSTPMTDNDLQVINVAGNSPANKGPLWAYANALMRAFPDCPMVIGISAWPGSGLWQVVDDTGDATESNTRLWSDEELTFRQVAPQWQSGRPAVIGLLMEEYTFNFNMGTDKDKVAIPMVFGVDMDGNAFPRGGSVSSDYTGKSYRIDHFMSDLIDFEGGSRFAVTPLNWYEDAVTGNAELAANAHIGQYVSQKHPRPDWNTLVMGRDDGGSWSDLIHFTRASRYGMERRAFLDGLAIAYNFDQWTPPASKLDTIIWPTEEGDDKKVVYLGIAGQDIETLARVENITVDDHLGEVAGLIINGEVCTTATIETHDGRKMIAIRKGDGSDWVKADTLEWDPYLTQALDEDAQAAHDVPFGLVQPGVVSSLTGLKIWPIDLTVDAGFFLNQVPAPPASLETEGRSVRLPLSNIHASADQRTYIQIPSYATEAAPIWGGGGALVVSLAMSALFGRNTSLAGYLPAILSIDGGGNTGNSINVVIDNGYTDRLRITIGGTVSVYLDLPNDDRRLLLVIRHDATSGYAELYRDGIQLESVAFAPPAAMVDMGRRDQGHAIGTPRNWWGGANGGLRGWSGEVGFYGYMPGIALTQAHCEAISAGSAPESVVSGWRYAARFNRPDDIELLADTLGVGVPTIIQGENAPAATPGGDITASVSGAARFRLDVIHDGHVWGVAPGETTQKISVSGVASGVTGPVEARYFDADGTIRLDWSELEGVSLTGATDESFEGRTINAGSIGNGWGRVDVRPVNAPALMQRSRTHCGIGYDYTVWGQGDTHSAGSTRSFVTPASTVAAISAARYEGGRALQTVASGALALSEGHAAASHLVADTTTAPVRVVWYTTPGTGPGNLVRDSYTNANLDWPMVEALSAEMNQASTTHIFDFFNVSVNYQPVTSKVLEPFLYGDDNPELPYFSIDHYLYDGVTFPVDAGFTAMEQAPAWVGLGRTDTDWQGPFNRSVDDTLQPGQADTYENTVERYNADADVAAWSAAKGYYFGPSRLDQQGRDGDENHPDPSDTYGAARAGLAQLIAGFRASNLLSRDDARLGQPSLSGAAITIPVLNLHGGTLKTGYAQRGTTPASGWPTVAGFEIRIGSGEWSNGNTVTGRAASEFTAEISGSDVVITRTDAAAWPTNEDIEIRYIGPGGVIYGSRAPVNLRHGLLYAGSPNADDAAYRIEDGHGVLVRPARGLMIEAA